MFVRTNHFHGTDSEPVPVYFQERKLSGTTVVADGIFPDKIEPFVCDLVSQVDIAAETLVDRCLFVYDIEGAGLARFFVEKEDACRV